MAKFNKVCWTEADVRCPFYLGDDRRDRSIRCEGYSEQTQVLSRFKSLDAKDRHMGIYCVGRFERCPVYKCTYEAKYADD